MTWQNAPRFLVENARKTIPARNAWHSSRHATAAIVPVTPIAMDGKALSSQTGNPVFFAKIAIRLSLSRSEAMDDLKPGAGLPDVDFLPISCPKCGRKANSARDEVDPRAAVRAEILCPDCVGGDFGTTTYFNAQGRELLPGPDGYEESN